LGGDVCVDFSGGDGGDYLGRKSGGEGGELAWVEAGGKGFLEERCDAGRLCAARFAIEADDEKVLAGVVDGDVLARLKEAELADALRGNTGGSEVGNAAGLEFDADVGDVDFGREDGQTDGAHFADGRGGEGEDDVEVVNHQVEDHIYIERAGREDGEPVGLEKHGAAELWLDGEDGGVEALKMAGLEDAAALFSASDQVVGFSESGGERLFDEQVDAGFEQGRGYGVVVDGGNGDGGGVEMEVGGEESFDRSEDGDCVLFGGVGGAGRVGLNCGGEGDTEAGRFQFAIDTKVIAAKSAGSGNGNAQNGRDCYGFAPFPSTALRQRL